MLKLIFGANEFIKIPIPKYAVEGAIVGIFHRNKTDYQTWRESCALLVMCHLLLLCLTLFLVHNIILPSVHLLLEKIE